MNYAMQILLLLWTNSVCLCCYFETTSNHRLATVSPTATHNAALYRGDCEFICFKNSSCKAANLVKTYDGSYQCEILNKGVSADHLALLTVNPGGKYIVKIGAAIQMTDAVDRASCDAASTFVWNIMYSCTKALQDTSDPWIAAGTNAWFKYIVNQRMYMMRIRIWPRCQEDILAKRVKTVRLDFEDGSSQTYSLNSCGTCLRTEIELSPAILSSYVQLTAVNTCDTTISVNIGYQYIAVWGILI